MNFLVEIMILNGKEIVKQLLAEFVDIMTIDEILLKIPVRLLSPLQSTLTRQMHHQIRFTFYFDVYTQGYLYCYRFNEDH